MTAWLGQVAALLALAAASCGAITGLVGGLTDRPRAAAWSRRFAVAFGALTIGAAVLMEVALLAPDFSVSYVALVGSRTAPTWVRMASLWSSLEGSILLWASIIGAIAAIFALRSRTRSREHTTALGILLAIGAFFALLVAGPANPFGFVSPAPLDGPGPNPLLQNHVLMAIHPPMLYAGYVTMSAPFALAAAALFAGRFDAVLLKSLRAWLLGAWAFLTAGIVLGAWWAYAVLGWGGYWAWDPVENASLMPWLCATSALHALLIVERRGALKGWSLTLVMSTFLLTLLGTFVTRSGVFNSVHSFSQSAIGPTLLGFLALCLVFSVVLLSARLGRFESAASIDPVSREGAFLANNLFMLTLTFTVLVGTIFPLALEAFTGRRISVGEPYFNRMALPLGVGLIFLMAIGPSLPWGRVAPLKALRSLAPGAALGAGVALLGLILGLRDARLLVSLAAGAWALQVALRDGIAARAPRRLGAHLAHVGVLIALLAVAASATLKQTSEVTLQKGQSSQLGPYTLTYLGARALSEPHRTSTVAIFALARNGAPAGFLAPRINVYQHVRDPIGTPDVRTTWRDDVYLSLVSVEPDGASVGLRAFLNPFVGWIWFGGVLAALGGIVGLLPRRREVASAALSAAPHSAREEAAV